MTIQPSLEGLVVPVILEEFTLESPKVRQVVSSGDEGLFEPAPCRRAFSRGHMSKRIAMLPGPRMKVGFSMCRDEGIICTERRGNGENYLR